MRTTINGVDCYGEMNKFQNINVICENESYDDIHPDGFDTWEEAVKVLSDIFHDIVELEVI